MNAKARIGKSRTTNSEGRRQAGSVSWRQQNRVERLGAANPALLLKRLVRAAAVRVLDVQRQDLCPIVACKKS